MRRVLIILSLLMLSPLATFGRQADQPARHRLLVLPFTMLGDDPRQAWIGQAIQQNLQAEVGRSSAIEIVNRVVVQAPAPMQQGVLPDDPTVLTMAREEGATVALFGSYQVADANLRVTGKMLDVASGQAIGFIKASGPRDQLLKVEDALASQAMGLLGIEPARNLVPLEGGDQLPAPVAGQGPRREPEPSPSPAEPTEAVAATQAGTITVFEPVPAVAYEIPYVYTPTYVYGYPYYPCYAYSWWSYPSWSFALGFAYYDGYYPWYGRGYYYHDRHYHGRGYYCDADRYYGYSGRDYSSHDRGPRFREDIPRYSSRGYATLEYRRQTVMNDEKRRTVSGDDVRRFDRERAVRPAPTGVQEIVRTGERDSGRSPAAGPVRDGGSRSSVDPRRPSASAGDARREAAEVTRRATTPSDIFREQKPAVKPAPTPSSAMESRRDSQDRSVERRRTANPRRDAPAPTRAAPSPQPPSRVERSSPPPAARTPAPSARPSPGSSVRSSPPPTVSSGPSPAVRPTPSPAPVRSTPGSAARSSDGGSSGRGSSSSRR